MEINQRLFLLIILISINNDKVGRAFIN